MVETDRTGSIEETGSRGMGVATRGFAKSFESLGEVFRFLDSSLAGTDVDDRTRMVLHLAVEELFTNMVKYNSGQSGEIDIEIRIDDDRVWVALIDRDTDPFDLSDVDPVDVDQPIERRRRGGLGLHLVRSMVDTLDYQYRDREMRVSVSTLLE
jgi:anti-sigma regulatory factor (Ser/Thr protein kinase)